MAMPEEAFIGAQIGGQDQDPSLTGPPYGNGRWVEGDVLHVSLLPLPEGAVEGHTPFELHAVPDLAPEEPEAIAGEHIEPEIVPDQITEEFLAIHATAGLAAIRRRFNNDNRSPEFRTLKERREERRELRAERKAIRKAERDGFEPTKTEATPRFVKLPPPISREQADADLRRHSATFKSIADARRG